MKVILSKDDLDKVFGEIKNKLAESVLEDDPHEVTQYLCDLTSISSNLSILIGCSRYYKDKDKTDTYLYEACQALQKDVHYRITALSSVLGFLGKERLSSKFS